MHRLAMQLQSLGKLTAQISRISSTCAPWESFLLCATRSITKPQASDHMTLVWFSTLPEEKGRNERQPEKSDEAKM